MIIEIKDPNYKVGQEVKFNCELIKMVITVEITKVTLIGDVTANKYEYRYDFKHNIPNGWTWGDVSEKTLDYDNPK